MHTYCDIFKNLNKYKDWAPLILRVIVGIFFIGHAWSKLSGMDGFIGLITGMLGLPVFFAYLVAWSELIGGILLIIGLFTRYASILLSTIMLVAIFTVKIKNGFMAAELDITFLAILISLLFTGAGKYGLDLMKCKKK